MTPTHQVMPGHSRVVKFSVSMDPHVVQWIDKMVEEGVYASTSHALKYAVLQLMRATSGDKDV